MTAPIGRLAVVLALLALAGCGDKTETKVAAPPVRPVLTVVASPRSQPEKGFVGSVQPQNQAELGFRVPGRIVSLMVDTGALVKKGQLLATVDSIALELSVRAAEADLAGAKARQVNAAAGDARQQTLLKSKVATPADSEAARQGSQAADASVTRAESTLAKMRDQLGYARIVAEFDGVVTARAAEVGQNVAAGQTVITLARPDTIEAVIDVPSGVAEGLSVGNAFKVTLQIDPAVVVDGSVRKIAPQADAATRTRRIYLSLAIPPPSFRVGSTVSASFQAATVTSIELPSSAILKRDGKTMVWVVDPDKSTVSEHEVQVSGGLDGSVVAVRDGLPTGARVLVAGVNSVTQGQKVRLEPEQRP